MNINGIELKRSVWFNSHSAAAKEEYSDATKSSSFFSATGLPPE